MVPSSLRRSPLVTRLRNSTLVHRTLRRLDALLHNELPALGTQSRTGADTFADTCSLHAGSASPPIPHPDVPSPLVDEPRADGFANPVLTASDVSDYGAVNYVADPFLLLTPERWHLYFEIYNPDRAPSAVIGHATSADSGHTWTYRGQALNPGVHTSFPYVFRYDDSVWMVPNLDPPGEVGRVLLYESADGNTFVERSILAEPDASPTDRVVFRWQDRWWLLVSIARTPRELRIYYSDSLTTPRWTPHQSNPVAVGEPRIPGGRPVVTSDRIVAFFQNGANHYGDVVEAYEITTLSPSAYDDRRIGDDPVVGPSGSLLGWNSGRMHTFDPWYTGDRWVCAVDGDTGLGQSVVGPHWSLGLYSVSQ